MSSELDLKTIGIIAGLVLLFILLLVFIIAFIVAYKLYKNSEKKRDQQIVDEKTRQDARIVESQRQSAEQARLEQERFDEFKRVQEENQMKIAESQQKTHEIMEVANETSKMTADTLKAVLEHVQGLSKIDTEIFNDMVKSGIEQLSIKPGKYDFPVKKMANGIGKYTIEMRVYQGTKGESKKSIPVVPCSHACYEALKTLDGATTDKNILLIGTSQVGKTKIAQDIPDYVLQTLDENSRLYVFRIDAQRFKKDLENDPNASLAMFNAVREFQNKVMRLARENEDMKHVPVILIDELDKKKKDDTGEELLIDKADFKNILTYFTEMKDRPKNLTQIVVASANNPDYFRRYLEGGGTNVDSDDEMTVTVKRCTVAMFERINNWNRALDVLFTLLTNEQHDPKIENYNMVNSVLYRRYFCGKDKDDVMKDIKNTFNDQEKSWYEFTRACMRKVTERMNQVNERILKDRLKVAINKIIEDNKYQITDQAKITKMNELMDYLIQEVKHNPSQANYLIPKFVKRFVEEILGFQPAHKIEGYDRLKEIKKGCRLIYNDGQIGEVEEDVLRYKEDSDLNNFDAEENLQQTTTERTRIKNMNFSQELCDAVIRENKTIAGPITEALDYLSMTLTEFLEIMRTTEKELMDQEVIRGKITNQDEVLLLPDLGPQNDLENVAIINQDQRRTTINPNH